MWPYPLGLQGIYISRFNENISSAQRQVIEQSGLQPGDQILSVNYVSLLNCASCQRVLDVIASTNVDSQLVLLTVLPRCRASGKQHRQARWNHAHDPRHVSPPAPDSALRLVHSNGHHQPKDIRFDLDCVNNASSNKPSNKLTPRLGSRDARSSPDSLAHRPLSRSPPPPPHSSSLNQVRQVGNLANEHY